MKLKELINTYGEYEVDLKSVLGNCEVENIVISLTKQNLNTVWDLQNGDSYFYSDTDGKVVGDKWQDFYYTERDVGNAFLTKEEALKDVERRKIEVLLLKCGGRRWFNEHNYNYHIGLDEWEEHLKVYFLATPTQGMIYFDTKEQAENAISIIGEKRLKKALFEVR